MAICELCLNDTDLIKKSHIYPNFLYKGLFDSKHTIRQFTIQDIIEGNLNVKRPRTGVYEANLLCPMCENRVISNYESYAAKLFNCTNNNIKVNKVNSGEINYLKIEGLDYGKVKNFFLSILYKADASKFKEFDEISLGPYKDKIRISVLNNSSLDDLDFQINILKFEENSSFNEIILQPLRTKINTETNYVIFVRGFFVVISVKQNSTSKKLKNQRLKMDGSIEIPIIPLLIEQKFMREFFGLNRVNKNEL